MATTYARYESNQAFMGRVEKFIRIQDPVPIDARELWTSIEMAWLKHLSRGLPSTCEINATLSCCILPG
jgi:hypothetical protein